MYRGAQMKLLLARRSQHNQYNIFDDRRQPTVPYNFWGLCNFKVRGISFLYNPKKGIDINEVQC